MVTMSENSLYSPHVSDSSNDAWFALMVRTNLTRTIEGLLLSKGFEAFAPCNTVKRRWCDRVATIVTPLFPGYVFVKLDPQRRLAALTTPGVYGMVVFGKSPAEIPAQEIANLKTLLKSGIPLVPCDFLRRGDRVRIEEGPLAGVSGHVIDDRKTYRLVVSVDLIERSVAVEVDRDVVRAWKPSPVRHAAA